MWLSGDGHLLITDSQGRQIGYIGNEFVNQIPDAYGGIIDGGLGIELEPIYVLPTGQDYSILLDGQTITQTQTVAVTQFGSGFATSVEHIVLTSSTQDELYIAPDGTSITYEAEQAREVTFLLAKSETDKSFQFQIGGADIGSGQVISTTIDTNTDQLLFNNAQANGGQYNLEIKRVSVAGQNTFVHDDIAITATDTHYLDYGSWNGTGSITLYIDHGSDGTIDETIVLENQIQTEGSMYLPIMRRN